MNVSYGGLRKMAALRLCNKYSKESEAKFDRTFPWFDAWVTVLGKQSVGKVCQVSNFEWQFHIQKGNIHII